MGLPYGWCLTSDLNFCLLLDFSSFVSVSSDGVQQMRLVGLAAVVGGHGDAGGGEKGVGGME